MIDRQIDGWIDRQMDRLDQIRLDQINRQIDRQTDKIR